MKLKHLILRITDKIMGRTPEKLWVEALRSGKYKQGTGRLENKLGFCCLGVACKVAETRGVEIAYERGHYLSDPKYRRNLKGSDLSTQQPVQEWLGLATTSGAKNDGPSLISLNDGHTAAGRDYTFAEIADIIESRPPGLFTE